MSPGSLGTVALAADALRVAAGEQSGSLAMHPLDQRAADAVPGSEQATLNGARRLLRTPPSVYDRSMHQATQDVWAHGGGSAPQLAAPPQAHAAALREEDRTRPLLTSTPPHARGAPPPAVATSPSAAATATAALPWATACSSPSGSAGDREPAATGAQEAGWNHLRRDELRPFSSAPGQKALNEVIARLGATTDWLGQCSALDDVRRLAAFTPGVLLSSKDAASSILELTLTLADSPRSALARNALRCLAELFLGTAQAVDQRLEATLATCLRRASDTNQFISEEGDQALREICRSANLGRLICSLLAAAAHKGPGVRSKAVWGLAMVAQRLGPKATACREAPAIVQVVTRALADGSPDVRLAASLAAAALVAGDSGLVGRAGGAIMSAIPDGLELATFDAFDRQAVQRFLGPRRGVPAPRLSSGGNRPDSGPRPPSPASLRTAQEGAGSSQWRKESEERRRLAGAAVVRAAMPQAEARSPLFSRAQGPR